MKKIILSISTVLLMFVIFIFTFHPLVKSEYDFLPTVHEFVQDEIDYVDSKEKAFKIAKQIWNEKYGVTSSMFMIFEYRFVDEKYWVIEGSNIFHRLFKINGGGPYIIIEKNGRVHNINYTK